MAEYDPKTGETSYPNGETDDAREAREKRERAGVGQPANPVEGGESEEEAAGGKHAQRQSQKDHETAKHKAGDA